MWLCWRCVDSNFWVSSLVFGYVFIWVFCFLVNSLMMVDCDMFWWYFNDFICFVIWLLYIYWEESEERDVLRFKLLGLCYDVEILLCGVVVVCVGLYKMVVVVGFMGFYVGVVYWLKFMGLFVIYFYSSGCGIWVDGFYLIVVLWMNRFF